MKVRIIELLGDMGSPETVRPASEVSLREYILAALESADNEQMKSIISRRLKAENDKEIISLLEFLQEEFNTQY